MNVLFAVLGFVLIEILLVTFWWIGARRITAAGQSKTADLEEANQALEEALQSAERAKQVSSDFLARMSHEIRTPMNGVLGMTNLLKKTPLEDDQLEMLYTIHSSGTTLQRILDDILDYSKLEAGRFELDIVKFRPSSLIREVATLFRAQAEARGLRLDCQHDFGAEEVFWGDQHRIRQVLFNLVGNSLKFTRRGSVTIRGTHGESEGELTWVCLEVCDTGIGIPIDQQEEVFSPFFQASSSDARNYGGTGLGLAICQDLIQAMKGTISLESEPGVGSKFLIRLPLYATDKGASDDLGIYLEKVQSRSLILPDAESLRLLVTDDDPTSRRVIVGHLRALGLRPEAAASGEHALLSLEGEQFDLVFMDCEMPGLDGFETTRRIRVLDESVGKRTPVVALTAHVLTGYRERCIEAGMDDYLPKPFTEQQLRQVLVRWLPQRSDEPSGDPDGTTPRNTREALGESGCFELSDFVEPRRLRELGRIGEATGTDLIGDLAVSLLESLPGDWSELRATILFDRFDEARPLAHKLKGALANVGASRLAERLAELEAELGDRKTIGAGKLEEVDSKIQGLVGSLRKYLDDNPWADGEPLPDFDGVGRG